MLEDTEVGEFLTFDACIEAIEKSQNFIVLDGWISTSRPLTQSDAVTMKIGRKKFRIEGLFPRPDLPSESDLNYYGFKSDHPITSRDLRGETIEIEFEGHGERDFDLSGLSVVDFEPTGGFDPSTFSYVAGWIYAPGMWHDPVRLKTLNLTCGDVVIPVDINCFRYELPFSAARAGKRLGFQISLEPYFDSIKSQIGPSNSDSVVLRLMYGASELASASVDVSEVLNAEIRRVPVNLDVNLNIAESAETSLQTYSAESAKEIGYIDFWSYCPSLQGWIVGGWIRNESQADADSPNVTVDFSGTHIKSLAEICFFDREDVKSFGSGFILYFPAGRADGALSSICVDAGNKCILRSSDAAHKIDEKTAVTEARIRCQNALSAAPEFFKSLIENSIFDGSDTISQLGPEVQIGIDETFIAPGEGAVIIGWLLDPNKQVVGLRVRSDEFSSPNLLDHWITTDRPDIGQAFGSAMGLTHSRWGFTTFAALKDLTANKAYLELRLANGRIGYRALPPAKRAGIAAITRMLNDVVLSADVFIPALQDVLATPARAINRARLPEKPSCWEAVAGAPPSNPRASIVIPLYGRLDFLTYQTALFDKDEHAEDEIIYVLDQPERKEECLELVKMSYIKYGVPIRLVIPEQNLGFAGASNAGMRVAKGKYLVFLNSDVIPKTGNWITRLLSTLRDRPDIGIISSMLLFDDESIQHIGMDFERNRQFGNLLFPFHPSKGRRPPASSEVEIVPAVTGACMVMERSLAETVGGFDEDYIIGDFEDADLCMKIKAMGFECAVDFGTVLYHLERQSQSKAVNRGRLNLTLLNAWTFAERWDQNLTDRQPVETVFQIV
ncbi:GT2 family glycosyltransferase [Rhizobium sp. SG_E_25_P2]|uniref:glycosyltransferase n=1 Tax=Rhizobium sp. SG_E_25_P2 TaxID=2879942 RepID=UPI0024761E0B|nr:glycosyltransferase [Rhizobium sp. SG_E_25_P2]MDH6266386.1 GT2 family glycosyltransferase [Rhizobium sp. SG_E_25_P2]